VVNLWSPWKLFPGNFRACDGDGRIFLSSWKKFCNFCATRPKLLKICKKLKQCLEHHLQKFHRVSASGRSLLDPSKFWKFLWKIQHARTTTFWTASALQISYQISPHRGTLSFMTSSSLRDLTVFHPNFWVRNLCLHLLLWSTTVGLETGF